MKKIPLFDLKLSTAAKREVAGVMNSGWLSTGPRVAAFEKKMTFLLKVPHAVAVSSGTAGLQLALQAIGVGPGREVITTPFTFVATIGAIMSLGARPVMADISPDTLNIDPDEVDRKFSENTGGVVPVDIAGHPADYDRLLSICDQAATPLIADAAHSIGATYRRLTIPNLADGAVISFYATKNL
ncbi:MAG: DegT/DnrJ/EryC1/StrS family aminotransferase, partial [candidate division Zixibacteria bacterium]|nr:DegT/DnrJ/EryC1/StrS family aminotransferase [candidate division Zixibacteria bacterium]